MPRLPRSSEWIAHGKEVYERRCLGCHGANGDGNGPAATFLYNQRPRNFTAAVFKFRLTKEPLPTDGDLLRTITRGVRGTAMPAWYDLPLDGSARRHPVHQICAGGGPLRSGEALCVLHRGAAGSALCTSASRPLRRSKFSIAARKCGRAAKCWECHGQGGKGDGEKGRRAEG